MPLKITVIGTGYLGATHAACMAELGFEVMGLDVTRFLEVLVRGGDGVVVDLEAAGQRAHAGQPLAMGEAAVEDLQLELGDELVADGNTAAAIEDDVQRHPARSLLRGGAVAPRPSFWTHPAPRAK